MTHTIIPAQELLKLKKENPALFRKTMRMNNINWRRNEIERMRALGNNFVNFTHCQTLEEAEAEIEQKLIEIEKEYESGIKDQARR